MLKLWALVGLSLFSSFSTLAAARQCRDIPPPPGNFSCSQEAQWNKCEESWMENYCEISCGRCTSEPNPLAIECPGPRPEGSEEPAKPYGRYQDLPWMTVGEWCKRFYANRRNPARKDAQLVFLGDSITEGWPYRAPKVWETYFGRYQPLHLGIGGDQTQQVLWRLEKGELDGLAPKVLVLLIGVNNIGWGNWGEADTARGVEAVLRKLRERLPETLILHLGIFPAMEKPNDAFRGKIKNTNALLAQLKVPGVRFLDLGSHFLNADGSISTAVMYDYLHPDEAGYRRWAEALAPELSQIFGY